MSKVSGINRQRDADKPGAELAGCLHPMIVQLSKDYRDAITLVEFEGLTQLSIARRIGVSLSGMKSRVQRGLNQFKQMQDERCLIQLNRRGEAR